MFTNWLTGTTGLTNSATSSTSNANSLTTRLTESNNHLNASTTITTNNSNNPAGLTLLNSHNNLNNLNSNIMSSPPDIVLEVGPAPSTIRFMAHGLVLGMHSGYLRSAIRLDERGAGGASNNGGGGGVASNAADIIVYLTNVTAEQFAPLLTYMYTGYLDLNVENIFGVLLATHVLHMPRALEICRSYLARAQTEGYFGPNNSALNNPTNNHQSIPAATTTSGKIIRPIASKPPLANFGFLPITHQPIALNPITPATTSSITSNNTTVQETKTTTALEDLQKDEEDDIEVDEVDKQSQNNENQIPIAEDEEEDVEVFIDSNSEAEVVIETQINKMSFKKLMENKKLHQERESSKKSHHRKSSHHNKSERRRKVGSSGLQVAKAPIPASQLDTSEANKVIIDVASCDGPVRFKRILNTAYGHKPEACNSNNHHSGGGLAGPSIPERSLQSVSLSFHQQMAKTISQQQQLQQAEESENSETSNGSLGPNVRTASDKASSSRKIQSEVFVCVYCKHTFKSQYCYQKHAKRHLNPLTLQATCVPEGKTSSKEESAANGELQITKHQNATAARPFYVRNSSHYPPASAGHNTLQSSSSSSTCSEYLRREVRPLDMNVQYYPCKTCGCKFPSYYFVHKHRKMCHAEEEAQQSASDNNNAANTTAVTAASINPDECLNTQSSD